MEYLLIQFPVNAISKISLPNELESVFLCQKIKTD